MKTILVSVALMSAVLSSSTQAQQPPITAQPTGAPPPAFRVAREKVLARYGFVEDQKKRKLFLTSGIGRVNRTAIARAGASSLRFHFVVDAPSTTKWVVQIIRQSDPEDVVVWTYSGESGEESFWSDEIAGNRAIIEILSFERNSPLSISISQILTTGPVARPQNIYGTDDRLEIRPARELPYWSRVQEWGKSIARLRFVGDDGVAYYCTAFLVSSDLMLTNEHCIRSDAERQSALVDFNYLSASSTLKPLRFKELVLHEPRLDYTLLRLESPVSMLPLKLKDVVPTDKRQLLLIEHPGGEVKQVSIKDCVVHGPSVVGVEPGSRTDFGHYCDTLGGSSGSPVFDGLESGNVMGLHHFGFEDGVDDPVNQAVRIGLILQDIARQKPSVAVEIQPPPP